MIKTVIRFVTIITLAVTSIGCERSPAERLNEAEQFFSDRKYRSAIIELKAHLQHEPNDVKARWLLGQVYLAVEDGAAAEKEIRRARSLGVVHDSLVTSLAKALLQQGKLDELINLEDQGSLSSITAAELQAYRGRAKIAKGEREDAAVLILPAAAAAPSSVVVRFAQAQLLATQGQFEQAKAMINSVWEVEPEHGEAWSLLGDIYLAEEAYAEAENAFTKALSLRSDSVLDRVKRGISRVGKEDFNGAAEDANALLRVASSSPRVQFFAGLVRFHKGEFEGAAEALEMAFSYDNQHFQTIFYLAATHFQLGNSARATTMAEKSVALAPGYDVARKLLASLYLQQGRAKDAEKLVATIVDVRPDDLEAKNILANSLMIQGKFIEATALLKELAAKQQDQPQLQLRTGISLLLSGDTEGGTAALRRAAELTGGEQGLNAAVVASFLQANLLSDALAIAEKHAGRNPRDPAAHNLLGIARLAGRQSDEARASFKKAIALDPGNASASQNLAALALREGDNTAARSFLEQALKKNPNNLQLLHSLAALAAGEQKTNEAVALFQKSLEVDPNHVASQIALARLLTTRGNASRALSVLSEASSENSEVQLARVDALLETGQFTEARSLLEQLRDRFPKSLRVYTRLTRVYAELGDRHGLKTSLEKLLQLNPNSPIAVLSKARLLALEQRFGEADKLMSKLELPSDDPNLLNTQLFLERARGNTVKGLDIAKALHVNEQSTKSVLALSAAYARAGDLSGAKSSLVKWLAQYEDDDSVALVLSELYIRQGQLSKAVETLERVIDRYPNHVSALNNLAWYLRKESPQRSLHYAKRVYELAPSSIDTLDTYAEVLARNGERELALRIIDRAVSESKRNPMQRLRRAEINALVGDRGSARDEAQAVASSGEASDEARERALALLEEWQL